MGGDELTTSSCLEQQRILQNKTYFVTQKWAVVNYQASQASQASQAEHADKGIYI